MGFVFKKCGRQSALPITKAAGKKAKTLKRLRSFLDAQEPQTVRWLVDFWDKQQAAVTYKELREAVLSGGMSEKQLEKWQKDYAKLVNTKLAPQWEKAMAAAAEARKAEFPYFLYDPGVEAAQKYIWEHGAQLITNLAADQKEAIRAMLAQATHYEAITADSLSQMIRPVIGLTKPQALANLNYYNAVKTALLKAHPRMTQENADKKARDAAAKYAARQHRYRAMNIARTELAAAYNQGGYGATKDAQERGYIGDCKKTWLTADDERVCEICGGIDGESVNMDALFSIGKLLPPAHPSCRCGVAYEEIGEPMPAPVYETDGTGELWEREPEISITVNPDGSVTDNLLTTATDSATIVVEQERHEAHEGGGVVNPLPNIDKMRIPVEKFTKYALDFQKDKDKAMAFQSALGYNKANVNLLIADIYANAGKFNAEPKGDDGYGMRYEVVMELIGVNGKTANVLTAWIDDKKSDELRLISAYIDKPKGGGK